MYSKKIISVYFPVQLQSKADLYSLPIFFLSIYLYNFVLIFLKAAYLISATFI